MHCIEPGASHVGVHTAEMKTTLLYFLVLLQIQWNNCEFLTSGDRVSSYADPWKHTYDTLRGVQLRTLTVVPGPEN